MRRLAGGFEVDDDPARIDVDEVHRFLSIESAHLGWLLQTADAHTLYERFGFGVPSDRVLERRRG